MRVLLLKADDGGCGFYRMEEPARVAKENGIDVEVRDFVNATTQGQKVLNVNEPTYDVFVFQRPLNHQLVQAMEILQSQGRKVMVELDDDLVNTPMHNDAYHAVNPKANPYHNWSHLVRACKIADGMIVSTPALQKYKPGARVVRNCVPQWVTEIEHTKTEGLGWSGTISVHREDLEVTRGALSEFKLHVVGESAGVQEALHLENEPTSTGWMPLAEYHQQLGRLQVGIAPLAMTGFNACKSNLKIMEFAAGGTPFVCSPSEEYVRFVEGAGVGSVAKKPRNWRSMTSELLDNADMRDDVGGRLREHVKERWTYEGNVERWVDAWQSVLK